ncbi:MAG: pilus assembly PilX N-terminal domain-containing protein [Mariprofundaceae bacterium]|nr:pilus assembly PilX N-terminal domain-containing protein [Mariprofundaceae bacterium]
MNATCLKDSEKGFVLATSLVMLLLLTTLSIATYYGTVVSQQTSATAARSTQAYYYAETGLNYMAWAIQNDAELDAYDPMNRSDPYGVVTLNAASAGDRREWAANKGNPSQLDAVSTNLTDIYGIALPPLNLNGQLKYFDNRDLYSRPVGLSGGQTLAFNVVASPVFNDIYTRLSGYIRLDIDVYGNVVSSLSPYANGANNHALPTHVCNGRTVGDVPCNGAIVWLTAGDPYSDFKLSPVDTYAAPLVDKYGSQLASSTLHTMISAAWKTPAIPDVWGRMVNQNLPSYYSLLNCDVYTYTSADIACDKASRQWLTGSAGLGGVHLAVYAIGYVNGESRKMIRMLIQ